MKIHEGQITVSCNAIIFVLVSNIGHGFIAYIQEGHATTGRRGLLHSVRRPYYEPCSIHLCPVHFDCMHVVNLTSVIRHCCVQFLTDYVILGTS